MKKLGLNQSLQQKLSPQQIQFIKLLQVPTAELESRIEEELEINPALEEGEQSESEQSEADSEVNESEASSDSDKTEDEGSSTGEGPVNEETPSNDEEIDIKDYLRDDD